MFGQQCAEATAAAPAARKNSTTIKTIFKQTNSSSRNIPRHPPRRARPTLSALQCPVLSLSVLIYWRLAHCLGCQKKRKKEGTEEGRGARRKGK